MYLDRVRRAGMEMVLYERYIDDSNQVAKVPPPRATYDRASKKVVLEVSSITADETDDVRLARVLREVANDVLPEINCPSKNEDGKMPILDMEVWQDSQEGYIMFQHYQKPMESCKILLAMSAQSGSCKQSVQTQEILRRFMNSSSRLDWKSEVAPVISQ